MLQGYATGAQIGESLRAGEQHAADQADANARFEAELAQREARAQQEYQLHQQLQQEKAETAARNLAGMQEYQSLVASGLPKESALMQAAPNLFYKQPDKLMNALHEFTMEQQAAQSAKRMEASQKAQEGHLNQLVTDAQSKSKRQEQQDSDTKGFVDSVNAGDDPVTAYGKFPMATGPLVTSLMRGQETIEASPEGGVKIVRSGGVQKPGKSGTELTVGAKTEMQKELANYEAPIATIGQIQKNMRSTDFGLAGKVGEFMDGYVAQVKPEAADPRRESVRNALRFLRADLYKSLRSDSNITKAEQEQIAAMLPSDQMSESLPRAAQMLIDTRNELITRARDKSQRLGVLAPKWALNPQEIKDAYKLGKQAISLGMKPDSQEFRSRYLTEQEAVDSINKYFPEVAQ